MDTHMNDTTKRYTERFIQNFNTAKKVFKLDGNYAAFGHVTEGLEIVQKIAKDAKPTDNNGTIPADAQPVIESIVIVD